MNESSKIAPKTKARLIILVAFVMGILTGVGVMNLLAAKSATERRGMADELVREVGLNAEQRRQVEAILGESRQQYQEVIKNVQPQLTELRSATRARISRLLTPQQQARFDEWNRRHDNKRDSPPASPSPAQK